MLATWLKLKVDAATAVNEAAPSTKRGKKRKQGLDPVARELAAAAGERGNLALQHSRILENIFVSYARVVKNGASSPLLPAVLKGIAKFAHQVRVACSAWPASSTLPLPLALPFPLAACPATVLAAPAIFLCFAATLPGLAATLQLAHTFFSHIFLSHTPPPPGTK